MAMFSRPRILVSSACLVLKTSRNFVKSDCVMLLVLSRYLIRVRAVKGHASLVPSQHQRRIGDYIVLPARNSGEVVGWRTRVEVPRLAAQGNESPHVNFNSAAEIKHSASELPGDWVRLAVNPLRALLIIRIAAAGQHVGRDPRSCQELHANSGRDIQTGEIVSRRGNGAGDVAQRIRQSVNLAVERHFAGLEEAPSVIHLKRHAGAGIDPRNI